MKGMHSQVKYLIADSRGLRGFLIHGRGCISNPRESAESVIQTTLKGVYKYGPSSRRNFTEGLYLRSASIICMEVFVR